MDLLTRLIFDRYIESVIAYLEDEDGYDEELMRAIETNVKPSVPETAIDTFRQSVMVRIGTTAFRGGFLRRDQQQLLEAIDAWVMAILSYNTNLCDSAGRRGQSDKLV